VSFRVRVRLVLRRKGFPAAGCAAMIARAQVQSCQRNRNIKAQLSVAVSLLAECQRRRMKTGFLLHEYSAQPKRLFGCWHNRGRFGGGGRRNVIHAAHTGGRRSQRAPVVALGQTPAEVASRASQLGPRVVRVVITSKPKWWAMGAKVSGSRIKAGARVGVPSLAGAIGNGLQGLALWRAGVCLVCDATGDPMQQSAHGNCWP